MSNKKPTKPKELPIEETKMFLKFEKYNILSICVDKENLYLGSYFGKFSQTPLNSLDDLKKKDSKNDSLHTDWVCQIRKRKKDNLIVVCSSDTKIIVTDPKTQEVAKEFFGNTKRVYGTIDYKNRIYSFGQTQEILCWDFETTQLVKRIQTQDNQHLCVTLEERSGKIFAGTNSGKVTVLDPECNEVVKTFQADDYSSLINDIVSRDGVVYTASSGFGEKEEGSIKSWDAHSYQNLQNFKGHENGTKFLRIKWGYLFSGGYDGKLKIWDLETTQLLYFVSLKDNCSCCFDLNKKYIYAANVSSLALINIGNELEIVSHSSNNFLKIFKNQKFCDLKIFGFPVHKFLIKLRCSMEPAEAKKILENNFTKEETFKFLEWVYGKKIYFYSLKEIEKIFLKLEIPNYKTKTLQSDLIKAYSDDNSKEVSIIVKHTANKVKNGKREKHPQTTEIKVHKFILLAKCGLFRAFFEFVQEKNQTKNNKIQDYSGKSLQALNHFFKYLYFNHLELTSDDDPQLIYKDLFDAQDYYQLHKHCNFPFYLKKIKKKFNLK
ncbi:hypothetical protein M0813_09460 [Anaeramoeba flamelloides]|uniref:BTB domain-containing protein n=1 Tax=Anaeramoeba flamelloides TaxID=1746091 RepID=A0AAV7ZKI4_9EUKA|nr:hypothetical protein M0812_12260 [Anaeramoeba flamelloides]KAJ6227800.1 hypothetical protein M0813_09460 [Anaeramoeba flamelloides]